MVAEDESRTVAPERTPFRRLLAGEIKLDWMRRLGPSSLRAPRKGNSRSLRPQIVGAMAGVYCLAWSVWLLWPILTAHDWYLANQSYRYPYLLEMFQEQFLAGQWYPRWLPELAGGYGYPTFVFYPPGFWFLALPFTLIASDVVMACKLALLTITIFAGVGAYRLARCYCGPAYAMVAVASFYVTPYFAKQIYDRGSLAELAATFLCPWVIYHLVMIGRTVAQHGLCIKHAIWLAVSLAAAIYTHPIVAAWLAVALIPCGIGVAMDSGKFWFVFTVLTASAVLAAGLSASYWAPGLSLREAVTYQRGLGSVAYANLSLPAIFSFERKLAGPILPVLAVAGAWLGRRSWFVMAALGCSVGFVAYMTSLSFPARHSFVALQYLQMPFRVLSVLAGLQLACVAVLLRERERRWTGSLAPLVVLGVVATFAWSQGYQYALRGELDYEEFRAAKELSFENMTHTDEFRPKGAGLRGLMPRNPASPIATTSAGSILDIKFNLADIDIGLEVVSSDPATVRINQFYFPGWRVAVDGNVIQSCTRKRSVSDSATCDLDANGRIQVRLPHSGTHLVQVQFAGIPGSTLPDLATAAALLLCVLGLGGAQRWQHARHQSVLKQDTSAIERS